MEAVRLVIDELRRDPHQVFSRLRQSCPVARFDGGSGVDGYLVASWELVAQAAARVEEFSNHFRYVLFRQDGGTLGAIETGPTGPDVLAGEDPPPTAGTAVSSAESWATARCRPWRATSRRWRTSSSRSCSRVGEATLPRP